MIDKQCIFTHKHTHTERESEREAYVTLMCVHNVNNQPKM